MLTSIQVIAIFVLGLGWHLRTVGKKEYFSVDRWFERLAVISEDDCDFDNDFS